MTIALRSEMASTKRTTNIFLSFYFVGKRIVVVIEMLPHFAVLFGLLCKYNNSIKDFRLFKPFSQPLYQPNNANICIVHIQKMIK